MYAIVRTGGKQYRVAQGDVIRVEKLSGEPGDQFSFDEVLMVAADGKVQLGQPLLSGARVTAEVVDQDRHPKILIFKYRRRKRYRRKAGHRQPYTALCIKDISTTA